MLSKFSGYFVAKLIRLSGFKLSIPEVLMKLLTLTQGQSVNRIEKIPSGYAFSLQPLHHQ